MKKYLVVLCVVFLIFTAFVAFHERHLKSTLFIKEAASSENLIGTPPREEKEYKIAVQMPNNERPLILNTRLNNILNKIIEKNIWKASAYYKQKYYITSSEDTFIFRDIYFDTIDDLLEKNNSSLRLRWRWDDNSSYRNYVKGTYNRASLPTRVEIQSKVARTEMDLGFSTVQETRMEFAKDSYPIKNFFEEGKAHLLLPFFFEAIKTGRFDSKFHRPAQSITKNILSIDKNRTELKLIPKIMIVSRRHRFHLNLVTPWGSGPNPTNTFIITIDRFKGLTIDSSFKWEYELKKQNLSHQEELIEIEVEFERNTSTMLEQELQKQVLNKNEIQKIKAIQNLFFADHEKLATEIIKHLELDGYILTPKNKSKPLSIKSQIKE
jgi:hypothetical protein